MITMALFINTGGHPGVFGNAKDISGNNQSFYRKDHVSELIKEQENINNTLLQSLKKLTLIQKQQGRQQNQLWKEATELQHKEFKKHQLEQSRFENNVLAAMSGLNEQNKDIQTTLENDQLSNQDLFNNISALNESNHYTAKALQQYESYHNKISDQINYMLQLQADTEHQIDEQYNQHIKMNERLENQEALTEKTIRQLDQLRANLFERTNYLVDRVEESYHLTSTYIYELLKGSNQPFTFFISEEKSEDKKN